MIIKFRYATLFIGYIFFFSTHIAAASGFPISIGSAKLTGKEPSYLPATIKKLGQAVNTYMGIKNTGDLSGGYRFDIQQYRYEQGDEDGMNDYNDTYAIKISKDKKRHALYDRAWEWNFSTDKNLLALRNVLPVGKGYGEFVRIVNIDTKKTINLPRIGCTGSLHRWSANKLITTDFVSTWDTENQNRPLSICIWDSKGILLWQMKDADAIAKQFGSSLADYNGDNFVRYGFLPKQPNVFYRLTDDASDKNCRLSAIDLSRPQDVYESTFPIEGIGCDPYVELDLSAFSLNQPSFRWREWNWDISGIGLRYVHGDWKQKR